MNDMDVTFELMTIAHMIHRTHDNMIPAEHRQKVTGTHMRMIHFLYTNKDREIFQKDLEDFFQVRPSTISSNLRLMEKNGLIVRESVQQDARLKKIVLCEESSHLFESTQVIRSEIKAKFTKVLTPEEIKTLYTLLYKIRKEFDCPLLD